MQPDRAKRSVSQLKEYTQCPHRYYLHRVVKVWERPAAWLPQGLAVHEAAEAWEKSGRTMTREQVEEVYRASYVKHTNRLAADTPRFDYWFRSGPYDGARDIERRFGIGLEQVGKYLDYYEKHPTEVLWVGEDGTAGIELGFEMDLGGVPIRGYIDQIVWDSVKKTWVVRDVKTGKSPGDDLQLAVYAAAMLLLHGLEIEFGDYWMGKSGKPTIPYDLSYWTVERLTKEFQALDENILAERFEPDPEPDKCNFCPVASDCIAVNPAADPRPAVKAERAQAA